MGAECFRYEGVIEMISYLEFDELYVEHFLLSENKNNDDFYRFYLAVIDKMGESMIDGDE